MRSTETNDTVVLHRFQYAGNVIDPLASTGWYVIYINICVFLSDLSIQIYEITVLQAL